MKTIGQVIDDLKLAPSHAEVTYDFGGAFPTKVASWRGSYDRPALGWAHDRYGRDKPHTVESLVKELESAIDGREFHGWKGGEYRYRGSSPLHIDNLGESSCTVVTGVTHNSWSVMIHTAYKAYS